MSKDLIYLTLIQQINLPNVFSSERSCLIALVHKSLLFSLRNLAQSSLLSYLNLATLQAQLQYPLLLSSSIQLMISSIGLCPKNQLVVLLIFSQQLFSSYSSHQKSPVCGYLSANLNMAILSVQSAFYISAISLNLSGIFLFIYLQAAQSSFQTYGSSCSYYQDSSYSWADFQLYNLRLLHFLLTCSGLMAIQSSKTIVPTHLSSSLCCLNLVLMACRVGQMLFPNSLANYMMTFSVFSESLTPTTLKCLQPSLNIRLTLSYLFLRSFQLIFQPSLTVLKLDFPPFFMQLLQYSVQMCLRAADTLSTGILPVLYSFIRQRSRESCLAADKASLKGRISQARWSKMYI